MKADPPMSDADVADDGVDERAWRELALSRSLTSARSRAEQRVQRYLDAAFSLIDEKDSTEFTIQELIDRPKLSLRGFYQYFDGKDELLLALFEETMSESADDLREAVAAESEPLARLRTFIIRLHEWCEPADKEHNPPKRGARTRRAISEFSVQLAGNHPDRVKDATAPVAKLLVELLDDALSAGDIDVPDTHRTAAIIMQTVNYSWFANRLAKNPGARITAEETCEFCLYGIRARL
jgi:AcrR family transcriptional regulator